MPMMQTKNTEKNKKTAVVLVHNEIVVNAVKKVLETVGFEARQDVESCQRARMGFIGAYFVFLGLIRRLRAVNSSLPLVLIESGENGLDEKPEYVKEFYDVIKFDKYDEKEVSQKLAQWFSEGQGKFLVKEE